MGMLRGSYHPESDKYHLLDDVMWSGILFEDFRISPYIVVLNLHILLYLDLVFQPSQTHGCSYFCSLTATKDVQLTVELKILLTYC